MRVFFEGGANCLDRADLAVDTWVSGWTCDVFPCKDGIVFMDRDLVSNGSGDTVGHTPLFQMKDGRVDNTVAEIRQTAKKSGHDVPNKKLMFQLLHSCVMPTLFRLHAPETYRILRPLMRETREISLVSWERLHGLPRKRDLRGLEQVIRVNGPMDEATYQRVQARDYVRHLVVKKELLSLDLLGQVKELKRKLFVEGIETPEEAQMAHRTKVVYAITTKDPKPLKGLSFLDWG